MGDSRAWVAQHKVCWEIGPLRELVKGHGVEQTGYELTLFGRFDPAAEHDVDAAALRVYAGLHDLATEVVRSLHEPHVVIEVLPFDRSVHLRREAGFAVEVELTLVVSPPHPGQPPPAAETQRRMAELEGKLAAMGLHKKTWDEAP